MTKVTANGCDMYVRESGACVCDVLPHLSPPATSWSVEGRLAGGAVHLPPSYALFMAVGCHSPFLCLPYEDQTTRSLVSTSQALLQGSYDHLRSHGPNQQQTTNLLLQSDSSPLPRQYSTCRMDEV